jgi:hypothetical protein
LSRHRRTRNRSAPSKERRRHLTTVPARVAQEEVERWITAWLGEREHPAVAEAARIVRDLGPGGYEANVDLAGPFRAALRLSKAMTRPDTRWCPHVQVNRLQVVAVIECQVVACLDHAEDLPQPPGIPRCPLCGVRADVYRPLAMAAGTVIFLSPLCLSCWDQAVADLTDLGD